MTGRADTVYANGADFGPSHSSAEGTQQAVVLEPEHGSLRLLTATW
jgi:hypothetical protein